MSTAPAFFAPSGALFVRPAATQSDVVAVVAARLDVVSIASEYDVASIADALLAVVALSPSGVTRFGPAFVHDAYVQHALEGEL